MSRQRPDVNPQNELMSDLESIRKLLNEDDDNQVPDPPATSDPVVDDVEAPVLEDIFDPEPGADLPETEVGRAAITPALDENLIRSLLSDTWRDSKDKILEQARKVIDEHQSELTPEAASSLNDALKSRIDTTIQDWMSRIVVAHIAELHERMLEAVSEELSVTLDEIVKQYSESSDGQ
ncbi:MAG: hypothetical protein VB948_01010 [Pseudomonadales bacterium]